MENYKGTAYPGGERAITHLRTGLVSENSTSADDKVLYFDRQTIR